MAPLGGAVRGAPLREECSGLVTVVIMERVVRMLVGGGALVSTLGAGCTLGSDCVVLMSSRSSSGIVNMRWMSRMS